MFLLSLTPEEIGEITGMTIPDFSCCCFYKVVRNMLKLLSFSTQFHLQSPSFFAKTHQNTKQKRSIGRSHNSLLQVMNKCVWFMSDRSDACSPSPGPIVMLNISKSMILRDPMLNFRQKQTSQNVGKLLLRTKRKYYSGKFHLLTTYA